jgi:hypothetical protein
MTGDTGLQWRVPPDSPNWPPACALALVDTSLQIGRIGRAPSGHGPSGAERYYWGRRPNSAAVKKDEFKPPVENSSRIHKMSQKCTMKQKPRVSHNQMRKANAP